VRFTDEKQYFVSEASVYRLLKAHDLIASPAYIVIKAAEEFKDKTTAPNQLWQTDFTYLKITGWGWYYLSTVLDDFSRFIVAWKLCATMKAQDVTATLDLALAASGLDQMTVVHGPRLLSDNGSSHVATDLAEWLDQQKMEHVRVLAAKAGRKLGILPVAGSNASISTGLRATFGGGCPLRDLRHCVHRRQKRQQHQHRDPKSGDHQFGSQVHDQILEKGPGLLPGRRPIWWGLK
jgi:Integrase core domain